MLISRSTVMTGRYAHNTGTLINGDTSPETVLDQKTTLQYRLQQAGYSAFLVGERLIAQSDPGEALRALRGVPA